LEKQAERRFQSALDLGFALETLSESAISQASTSRDDETTRSVRRFSGKTLASAAVSAIAVCAFFAGVQWDAPDDGYAV
jgi:hypothetical protein